MRSNNSEYLHQIANAKKRTTICNKNKTKNDRNQLQNETELLCHLFL